MINAAKAKEIVKSNLENDIIKRIEAKIIEACREGNNECYFRLILRQDANVFHAKIAAYLVEQGYRVETVNNIVKIGW